MSEEHQVLDNNTTVNKPIFKDFDYPLTFEFKIGTFSNDFTARDASGRTIAYIRQKMFKFKEAVQVFSDESKSEVIYTIGADRIIDFNASYFFKNADGFEIGKVGRKGAKSILKAHYNIFDENSNLEYTITEENPWAKFWDALLSEIPLLGMLTGYLFNPKYAVKDMNEEIVARLTKEPSFFGRKFKLEEIGGFNPGDDERILLALMMMSLLERRRG